MSYELHAVVVGVADPGANHPALQAAIDVARRTGAAVHAVHAFELPLPFLSGHSLPAIGTHAMENYAAEERRRFEARMHELYREDPVVCHAVAESPERAILETADAVRAELVIVGASRHNRLERQFLGTTAQRVIRGAAAPVLVVRAAPLNTERVLITTDLTSASAAVYERGLDLVETLFASSTTEMRALLVLLTSLSPLPLPADATDRAAINEMATFLSERCMRAKTVTPVIRHGFPSAEIAAEAQQWGADLVLLGSHARRAPARWVLGSVAEAAVRDVRCNVLVVPPTAEGLRATQQPELAAANGTSSEGSR
jgi:universal stress protein E